MKITIPEIDEKPSMVITHKVNQAWVKRAILSYLRGEAGFTYRHGYNIVIDLPSNGGAIITVTEKPNGKERTNLPLINRFLEWAHNPGAKAGAEG